jgi:hypothetical protein
MILMMLLGIVVGVAIRHVWGDVMLEIARDEAKRVENELLEEIKRSRTLLAKYIGTE